MAQTFIDEHQLSVRSACQLAQISETCYRYQPKNNEINQMLTAKLIQTINTPHQERWGFQMCFDHLRTGCGHKYNRKRYWRLYQQAKLQLTVKKHQRIQRAQPEPLMQPEQPNTVLSIDFMHEQLHDGRSVRILNVTDDYNREALINEAAHSIPAQRLTQMLDRLIEWNGTPQYIRSDNGPEFISKHYANWARQRGITLLFTQPGNPQQNAYIERYNRTLRQELLNQHQFKSIEHLQEQLTDYIWCYNHNRPHSALGGQTPKRYRQEQQSSNKRNVHATIH